jgi:outer membrane protein
MLGIDLQMEIWRGLKERRATVGIKPARAWLLAFALAALAAAPTAPRALAGDNSGDTLIKVLGTEVLPGSDLKSSGDGVIDVSANVVPTLSIAYFLTKNIAVEAICCFTQHTISDRVGAFNGLGGGGPGSKVADVWIFPPTVSLQYHLPIGAFKPYVSVGASYMAFFDETSYLPGHDVDLKGDWGLSLGGGLDVGLGGGWQLSVDVKKILDLDSRIYVDGGYLDTVKLDPWLISVGVGYRFNLSDLLGP